MKINTKEPIDLLLKGTVVCHTYEALLAKLQKEKPMRIKVGFDPTAPDLHLGHSVLLRKMAQFQNLGHTILFLIGDFTGLIGDPTGKKITRPQLSKEQILLNAETYKAQVFKILDPNKTTILFNSEWIQKLTSIDWINLTSKFTLAQMIERNDFSKRLIDKGPISLHELLYPIVQAYDSLILKTDVEIGGNDQLFNLMCGRNLQKTMGQQPQIVITTPLLIGLDGKEKMSKSAGNYIGFTDTPDNQFGKVMSISDKLMMDWWLLLTDYMKEDIDDMCTNNPMQAKLALATEIVKQYHGYHHANTAKEHWINRFSKHSSEEATKVTISYNIGNEFLSKLLVSQGMAQSRKQAEYFIQQGAVSIDNSKINDKHFMLNIQPGLSIIVKVGKTKLQHWILK